ncbi:MAG: hypothetical protein KJN79_01150 [Gammaproteobacteria bacterium]|nr:hypothetical protein [Gammaproteobacteria bacterium]
MDFRTTPKSPEGKPISAPTFEDTGGLHPQWVGHLYTATAGATNIFDEEVTTEKQLRGGWYEVFGSDAAQGDYVELAVVDKNDTLGLFSTYGLTVGEDVLELKKYVKTEYVNPVSTGRQVFIANSVFVVTSGLFIRTIYESTGEANVVFKVVTLAYE